MTPVQDAFQVALSRFKKQLTNEEQEKFELTSFDQVRRAIHDIQKTQDESKQMMALRRIEGFLEAMNQFGQVIEVFLNASNFVCFVWGPLKFILQVCAYLLGRSLPIAMQTYC